MVIHTDEGRSDECRCKLNERRHNEDDLNDDLKLDEMHSGKQNQGRHG